MADIFKKEMDKKVGPGGVKCYCCNSYKRKFKKGLHKLIRKRLKNQLEEKLKNGDYAD